MKPDSTIRSIQIRLFLLLLRAFTIVVLLILALVLTITVVVISFFPSQNTVFDRVPIMTRLETFYLVRGSWDGVETLVPGFGGRDPGGFWRHSILLDADGKVVLFRGSSNVSQVGQVYVPGPQDTRIAIVLRGERVGTLVFSSSIMAAQGQIAISLLAPVFFISIFPAVLTIIIGLFLMRRVVAPLSEVIAAARAVAAGDLSTRVRVSGPDDLRALSDSFNHMADALERSDHERRNMLADIAHELRTPLTVIRGRLEGIVDGVYSADEGHVVPALEETYLLERLVEDLRLLTLVETRQLPFERRDVDLNALAARVIELFRAEAEEKGIHLSLETSEVVNAHLDPQRTEQVVSNLVSNALRYTPEGGNIWITVTKAAGSAALAVSDNGPGVPDGDIPHIFDRFWRGEKSRSRISGGAGLGLAIARQLVEAQSGTITASNRPGGGLELRVEFALS
jgi:signal transduction histidine kinase